MKDFYERVNELLHAVGKYAVAQGEEWRISEGLEIIEAYSALVDSPWDRNSFRCLRTGHLPDIERIIGEE